MSEENARRESSSTSETEMEEHERKKAQRQKKKKAKAAPKWTASEEDCLVNVLKLGEPDERPDYVELASKLAESGYKERPASAIQRRLAMIKKRIKVEKEDGLEYDQETAEWLGVEEDNGWTTAEDTKILAVLALMAEDRPRGKFWRPVRNWTAIAEEVPGRSRKELEARLKFLEARDRRIEREYSLKQERDALVDKVKEEIDDTPVQLS